MIAITRPQLGLALFALASVSLVLGFAASRAPLLTLAAVCGLALFTLFLRWPLWGVVMATFLLPFERIGAVDLAGVTIRPSQVVALILIVAWSARSAFRGVLQWRPVPVLWPVLTFLVVEAAGIASAANQPRAVAVFGFTAFTLAVGVLVPQLVRTERHAQVVVTALGLTTLLVSAFGLFQFLGDLAGLPTSVTGLRDLYTKAILGFPRVQSTALEPLYFANFLILPLSLTAAITLAKVRLGWFVGLPVLALGGVVFVLTVARGGYAGLAVALVIILAAHWKQVLHPGRLLGLGALVVIVGVLASQLLSSGTNGLSARLFTDHVRNLFTGASYEERVQTFDVALRAVRERPWLGVGPGQYGPYASINPSHEPKDGWKIVNNLPLELLAETGIIGFGAILVAWGMLIVRSVRAIRRAPTPLTRALIVGALAAFIGTLVQYQTFSIIYIMHVWVGIGLLIAFQNLALVRPRP